MVINVEKEECGNCKMVYSIKGECIKCDRFIIHKNFEVELILKNNTIAFIPLKLIKQIYN